MARILLLEPDRLLAGTIKTYLTRAGHDVAVHSNPQAAVTAADKQPPQIVVAELQLAGRSGVEFLYEFGSYSDWQAIPVIIYTSLAPSQVPADSGVLKQLNVQTCLYKARSSLDELLDQVGLALQPANP